MPLLADPEKSVIKAFDSLRPTGGLANRDTIVIDKKGTIRKIYRGVKNPADHADDVLKYIKDNLAAK
jgi:peroxiredoxin